MNIIREITFRVLKKNKSRTIATIIGVVLFVVTITGILSFANSFMDYKVEQVKHQTGRWCVAVENLNGNLLSNLELTDGFSYGQVQTIGYARFKKSYNPQKPYYYIANFDNNISKMAQITLIEGRMPINKNEIVVPEHIYLSAGVTKHVGDKIKVEIGTRINTENGYELGQFDKYNPSKEAFIKGYTKTYNIVGVAQRPKIEAYMAPGYTMITNDIPLISSQNYTFVNDQYYGEIKEIIDNGILADSKIAINEMLLQIAGHLPGNDIKTMIFLLASILICLIFVGAVMLLYNAFNNNVVERKKMYAMLATTGATGRNLKWLLIFESLFYGVISIPLGMFLGTFAYKTLVRILNAYVEPFNSEAVKLGVGINNNIYFLVVIITCLAIFVAVFRPLDMLIMTKPYYVDDGQQELITRKKFEPHAILEIFFGSVGYLAGKNFGRDRQRYKTTIISLALSTVLLLTASTISQNIKIQTDHQIGDNGGYDILYKGATRDEAEAAFVTLQSAEGITNSTYYYSMQLFKNYKGDGLGYNVIVMDDQSFAKYLENNDIAKEGYFDPNNPKFTMLKSIKTYNTGKNIYEERQLISDDMPTRDINVLFGNERTTLSIKDYADDFPEGVDIPIGKPAVIASNSAVKYLFSNPQIETISAKVAFESNDVDRTFNSMKLICRQKHFSTTGLVNLEERRTDSSNLLLLINLFTYGFVALLFIIALTNVINTISTNMDRREIEFATYLTIGMNKKDLHKMLFVESLLVGVKSLWFGIPIGIVVTGLIYKVMVNNGAFGYEIPVFGMLLSIFIVFWVVMSVSFYTTRKVKVDKASDLIRINNL